MYKLSLPLILMLLSGLSGCNQGEINLLKEQVAELKQENAELKTKLDEANIKLAKHEALNSQMTEKIEEFKKLMPDASGLGDILKAAKDMGLTELKDLDKKELIEKAKEKFKEKTTF